MAMSRRATRVTVTALATLAMVAAIGSATMAKKTTITFMHWYNFNPSAIAWMDNAVKEYQATHPDVVIKQVVTAWGTGYIDKALTLAAAGKPPDVAMVSGLLMTSMAGILTDVNSLVNTYGFDKSVSYRSMWRGCTYQGKVLGVPFAGGVQRAMFYNTELMQQRGWNPEKPPVTWSSFLEFCSKLTFDKNGDGKPDIFATDTSVGMYQMMEVAAGGQYTTKNGLATDWDSDASVKALGFADAIYRSKALGTWGGLLTGKCASYMQGPWEMANVQSKAKFKWGFTRYPTPTDDDVRLWASVDALGVCKIPADRRKVAFDFVRFLMSAESQATLAAQVGFPPMNRAALTTATYKQAADRLPQLAEASEIMQYAYAPDPTPKDGDVNTISDKWLWKVMGGGIGPREAANHMQAGSQSGSLLLLKPRQ